MSKYHPVGSFLSDGYDTQDTLHTDGEEENSVVGREKERSLRDVEKEEGMKESMSKSDIVHRTKSILKYKNSSDESGSVKMKYKNNSDENSTSNKNKYKNNSDNEKMMRFNNNHDEELYNNVNDSDGDVFHTFSASPDMLPNYHEFKNTPIDHDILDITEENPSIFKKIRRTTHLKKIDRLRFREEGDRKRERRQKDFSRVSAKCVCESFELTDILNTLILKHSEVGTPLLYSDVICFKNYLQMGDVFVFSYGVVVFWGFNSLQEDAFLTFLKPSESNPNDHESDEYLFTFGEVSQMSSDVISLSSNDILEKLSVSFAIAQSVKLSVFEERVENQIESNRYLPESLAQHGSIDLHRTDISKKIGQLFMERNSINLYTDILDTPEFFWEENTYQGFYARIYNYLEIGKRVIVLNKRLDIMKELFDMLSAELQDRHSSNLEYIIIWLIVIEVAIELIWQILIKDILKLF